MTDAFAVVGVADGLVRDQPDHERGDERECRERGQLDRKRDLVFDWVDALARLA